MHISGDQKSKPFTYNFEPLISIRTLAFIAWRTFPEFCGAFLVHLPPTSPVYRIWLQGVRNSEFVIAEKYVCMVYMHLGNLQFYSNCQSYESSFMFTVFARYSCLWFSEHSLCNHCSEFIPCTELSTNHTGLHNMLNYNIVE